MAITTRDGLIAALAAAQEIDFVKAGSAMTAGRYLSMFRMTGRPGAAGTPSTVAGNACSSATVGAIPFTNPSGSLVSYLAQLTVSASNQGSMVIYDRLVETALLSANVATAQTVGSAALPTRVTGGAGVALWLEVYTATGATASGTVTASYTNSAGVSGRTATLIGGLPASAAANTMIPFALQAGDTGVQSVQTVTIATATGTAGSVGITLLQRIAEVGLLANFAAAAGYADLALPQVKNDACLAMMCLSSGTVSTLVGSLSVAQG